MNKLKDPDKKKINKSYKIEQSLYLKIQKVFERKNQKISTYLRKCLIEFYEKEKTKDE